MATKKDFTAPAQVPAYNDMLSTALANLDRMEEDLEGAEAITATPAEAPAAPAPAPGRKGHAMKRRDCRHFNLALTPDQHDYLRTMAALMGISMNELTDSIINDYINAHSEVYKRAVELRKDL